LCKGTGGKKDAKKQACGTCHGKGTVNRTAAIQGSNIVMAAPCPTCHGAKEFFAEKDKCKKCKGAAVVPEKKILELYIPPGTLEGDHLVLHGEGDMQPGQKEPGDLIFDIRETLHKVFSRRGPDLLVEVHVSLAEALTGLDRVVVRHLDGRGIKVSTISKDSPPSGKVLKPGHVLRVQGEGMPVKKKIDVRGDLFIVIRIDFPKDGWLLDPYFSSQTPAKTTTNIADPLDVTDKQPVPIPDVVKLRSLLPTHQDTFSNIDNDSDTIIDEVVIEDGDLDDYGTSQSGRPRGTHDADDEEWEDEEEQPQCRQM
jgi:DnaJ homolog subfamily A member 2